MLIWPTVSHPSLTFTAMENERQPERVLDLWSSPLPAIRPLLRRPRDCRLLRNGPLALPRTWRRVAAL